MYEIDWDLLDEVIDWVEQAGIEYVVDVCYWLPNRREYYIKPE